jgi:hypothetical protein
MTVLAVMNPRVLPDIETIKGKGKGNVIPVLSTEHHAMEAYWGSGGTAPRILRLRH